MSLLILPFYAILGLISLLGLISFSSSLLKFQGTSGLSYIKMILTIIEVFVYALVMVVISHALIFVFFIGDEILVTNLFLPWMFVAVGFLTLIVALYIIIVAKIRPGLSMAGPLAYAWLAPFYFFLLSDKAIQAFYGVDIVYRVP